MKKIVKIAIGLAAFTGFCIADQKFGWNTTGKVKGAVDKAIDFAKAKLSKKTTATETIVDSTETSVNTESPS